MQKDCPSSTKRGGFSSSRGRGGGYRAKRTLATNNSNSDNIIDNQASKKSVADGIIDGHKKDDVIEADGDQSKKLQQQKQSTIESAKKTEPSISASISTDETKAAEKLVDEKLASDKCTSSKDEATQTIMMEKKQRQIVKNSTLNIVDLFNDGYSDEDRPRKFLQRHTLFRLEFFNFRM